MDNKNTKPVERKNSALLTAQLTSKLLDENLMQRYGTSLDINMGQRIPEIS